MFIEGKCSNFQKKKRGGNGRISKFQIKTERYLEKLQKDL